MRSPVRLLLLLPLTLSLPALGGERSAKELLEALRSPDYQTRRKAVLAVEGRREPELLDRLLEMAKSDPHVNIRGYAAEVLGTFKDPRIFPLLARMAQEEEFGARTDAYVALGKLQDPRGKEILLEGLETERGLRAYAAEGLGFLGDPEGFQPVARLLLDHAGDPYVAELAPVALERIQAPDALVFLRKHFVTLPSPARNSAARVLGRHPDETTRTMMEELLGSQDRTVRSAAIQVLRDLRDKRSTPALLAHLPHARPDERAQVIEALGKARDPRSAKPLIDALGKEKDLLPKMRLIEALGRLGDQRAIHALLPLIDDTTLLPQPRRISSVHGFPWNTRIHAASAWAILTIRDGKEPFPIADLSSFPNGDPPPRIAEDIAAIRKWARR